MSMRERSAEQGRRIFRLACLVALAAVLFAPLLLGPALAPLVHALGGEAAHHCACGMEPGKCGCPECEHQAQPDGQAHFVKSSCDDGGDALPAFGVHAVAVVPYLTRLAAPSAERVPPYAAPAALHARERERPPTPPPRG